MKKILISLLILLILNQTALRTAGDISLETTNVPTIIKKFKVTAYCPCEKCCGRWAKNRPNGIVYTASGEIAQEGITIATDWSVIPPGTKVEIEGIGMRIAQDRGESVKGNEIDVYFTSHEEAMNFGVKELTVKYAKPLL